MSCWRSECRSGCYYPDVCTEQGKERGSVMAAPRVGEKSEYDKAVERVEDSGRHVHKAFEEVASRPNPKGEIWVTELCDCGMVIRTYKDSIL